MHQMVNFMFVTTYEQLLGQTIAIFSRILEA